MGIRLFYFMKICTKCKIEKELTDFFKKKGHHLTVCKVCIRLQKAEHRNKNIERYRFLAREHYRIKRGGLLVKLTKEEYAIKRAERNKLLRIKNKERIKENNKVWRDKNKERIAQQRKEYRENNKQKISEMRKLKRIETIEQRREAYRNNKEYYQKHAKEYGIKNREKLTIAHREWVARKKIESPLFKAQIVLRNRVNASFKKMKIPKKGSYANILGAPIEVVKKHIERQFKKGMTWENRGKYTWHIDHIIPVSSAKTEEELIKLFHYTNLQPLWATENHKKSAKIINHQMKMAI